MHKMVPGPDGKLSYGGACFPKDINVLLNLMKLNNIPLQVLESTINERNLIKRAKNFNIFFFTALCFSKNYMTLIMEILIYCSCC